MKKPYTPKFSDPMAKVRQVHQAVKTPSLTAHNRAAVPGKANHKQYNSTRPRIGGK